MIADAWPPWSGGRALRRGWATVGALLAAAGPGATAAGPASLIWGGPGALLRVEGTRARLTMDCAEGAFGAPAALVEGGGFAAGGTFSAHGGGPDRPGRGAGRARFTGTVEGNRLLLEIAPDGGEPFRLDLRRGVSPKLHRCL